jgi:hypothetical protein
VQPYGVIICEVLSSVGYIPGMVFRWWYSAVCSGVRLWYSTFICQFHHFSVLAAIFKGPPEAAQASTFLHFQFSTFNLHTDELQCFYILIITKIACKSLYIVTFLNFELKQKCVSMVFTVIPVM